MAGSGGRCLMNRKATLLPWIERYYPSEVGVAALSNEVLEVLGEDCTQGEFNSLMRARILEGAIELRKELGYVLSAGVPRYFEQAMRDRIRVDFP